MASDGYDVRGWRGLLYKSLSCVPEGTTITLGLEGDVSPRITAGVLR